MSEPLIQRVYSVEIAGFDDAEQKIKALAAAFTNLDSIKRKLNEELNKKINLGDTAGISDLTAKLKELEKVKASVGKVPQNDDQKLKLDNERRSVQALEGSYNALKQQRLALEKLTANANPSSTITFEGKTFSFDEALKKIRELKAEELSYTQQLKVEKTIHENILVTQQGKINAIKLERTELENIVKNSKESSVVSFKGEDLTNSQALTKIEELKSAEDELTVKRNESIQQLITSKKQAASIEKEAAGQSTIDGREKILQLRAEREEEERLLALEKERLNTQSKSTTTGTFEIEQGSGQTSGKGIIPTAPKAEPFIPASDLEESILQLVKTKSALAGVHAEQKSLREQLKAGTISQAEFDAQIVKATAYELELKESIAATNREIKLRSNNIDLEAFQDPISINDARAQNSELNKIRNNALFDDPEKIKEVNALLDRNNKLIDENSDSLARQKINVGNYGASFKGALSVLETELTVIQGKLKTGALGGIEVEDLSKKHTVLTNAIALATKETSSATQSQKNYKEAATQVGLAFGTNSQVFKNFTAQVAASNKPLDDVNKSVNKTIEGGGKLGGVFSKMYSGLARLANLIPGLGISGLLLLLLTPLEALAASIFKTGSRAAGAKGDIKDLAKEYEAMGKAVHESQKAFEGASKNVNELKINIDLANEGFLNKKDVLDQYNDSVGKVTGKVKTLDEAEQALVKNGNAYVQVMLLKAAANIALEGAAKKAFEAEETRRKKETDFAKTIIDTRVGSGGAAGFGGTGFDAKEYDRETERIKNAQKNRRDQLFFDQKLAEKEQTDIARKFQEDAAKIAKDNKFDFFGETHKDTQAKGSSLDLATKEKIKIIEETQARLLAEENNSINEIQKVRDLSFDEERTHLKRVEEINVDALNSKIALIDQKKKLNNEELKDKAVFEEQRSSIELQTSQKINDINKKELDLNQKRFDEESKTLKKSLDAQKSAIDLQLGLAQLDPSTSAEQKAISTKTANDKILNVTQTYYEDLQELYVGYKISQSKQFDEESSILINQFKDRKEILQSLINSIDTDSTLTDDQKTKQKSSINNEILEERNTLFTKLDNLAEKSKVSYTNIEEEKQTAVNSITKKGLEETFNQYQAKLKDIEESHQKLVNETKANVASRTTLVLEDDSITSIEKARKIRQIAKEESLNLAALEEAAARISFERVKKALDNKLASEKEYSDAKARLKKAELELAKTQTDQELGFLEKLNQGFKNALNNLTDFFKGVKKTKEENKENLDSALAETAKIIGSAIDQAKESYFDNQRAKVDREKDLANERLNIEEEQVLNMAQSEAEKESIQRQFEARREENEKVASEKKKKIALQQMTIDFGIAVVKTLAEYPFPFSLIPVAGLTLAYILQRAAVSKQQFEFGGNLMERMSKHGANVLSRIFAFGGNVVEKILEFGGNINRKIFSYGGSPDTSTIRGGHVKGRSHADGGNPFIFKGRVFEDEVDELNIIRTKNVRENVVHTITGTHTQIASKLNVLGGGVEFKPGARYSLPKVTYMFTAEEEKARLKGIPSFAAGGYVGLGDNGRMWGDNLKPPINPQSYLNSSAANNTELKKLVIDNTNDLKMVMDSINQQTSNITALARQTNQRIDKLKVQVVTKEITNSQNNIKKATTKGIV